MYALFFLEIFPQVMWEQLSASATRQGNKKDRDENTIF
jgi:hypothetical protein